MNDQENEFSLSFKALLDFVEEERKRLTSFKVTNIEHKRIFWNNVSNLTAAQIAAIVILFTSNVSLNLWLASLAFFLLFLDLIFIQIYHFMLLLFEGRDIDKLEKTFRKLHDLVNKEFEEVTQKLGVKFEDFQRHFSEVNKAFWEKELKMNWLTKKIKQTIESDLFPALLLILYGVPTFLLIFSIDVIRCTIFDFLK